MNPPAPSFVDFFAGSGLEFEKRLGIRRFEIRGCSSKALAVAMRFQAGPRRTPWHPLSGPESRNFEYPISIPVHLGSIEQVRGTEIPKGDIVWASFPCQDLCLARSVALIPFQSRPPSVLLIAPRCRIRHIAVMNDLALEIEKALPAMNPESARRFETAVRAMLMLAKQGQSAVASDFDRLLQEEEALRATMRQQDRRFSANDRLSRDDLHDRHALR